MHRPRPSLRPSSRWSQEHSGGFAFDHAVDFCLTIEFSRLYVTLALSGVTPTG